MSPSPIGESHLGAVAPAQDLVPSRARDPEPVEPAWNHARGCDRPAPLVLLLIQLHHVFDGPWSSALNEDEADDHGIDGFGGIVREIDGRPASLGLVVVSLLDLTHVRRDEPGLLEVLVDAKPLIGRDPPVSLITDLSQCGNEGAYCSDRRYPCRHVAKVQAHNFSLPSGSDGIDRSVASRSRLLGLLDFVRSSSRLVRLGNEPPRSDPPLATSGPLTPRIVAQTVVAAKDERWRFLEMPGAQVSREANGEWAVRSRVSRAQVGSDLHLLSDDFRIA